MKFFRSITLISIPVFFVIGCSIDSKVEQKEGSVVKKSTLNKELVFVQQLHPEWFTYYSSIINGFDLNKFEFDSLYQVHQFPKGNILGDFDPDFNRNHLSFLINSPDSSEYIDLDSYIMNIEKNEKGELYTRGVDVHQEVDWVNRKTKEIKQLAFYGSSTSIDDAKWIDKSSVVLFGVSEQKLFFNIINLEKKKNRQYVCSDTLLKNKNFTVDVRLKKVKFD